MGRLTAAAATAAVGALLGCGPASPPPGGIEVLDPYAAEPVTREAGAVYLTIRNGGAVPDTLVGASTPVAAMTHLHRMGGWGAAQMRVTDEAEVPAGGQLQLQPGGLHLMLMQLREMPLVGDTITVTLQLRRAGPVEVRVPVVSYLEVGERAAVGGGGAP